MEEKKELTDAEKLNIMNQRLKRIEYSQHIQTLIAVIVFLGVINLHALKKKLK